jgi:hypothetical protein
MWCQLSLAKLFRQQASNLPAHPATDPRIRF